MALVDMKSNLAINAGTPIGSPEGRHDPDPDLATSTLDDIKKPSGLNKSDDIFKGALNFMINRTNPGGRFYRIEPPGPSLEPNESRSKLDLAVAYAKTKGMDYLIQKVKNIPNPASRYLSDEKWSGFLTNLGTTARGEQEEKGVLKLYNDGVSQFDRPEVGDYTSNFFTYQSPTGELWPSSQASIGGKLLPQAILSGVLADTNLFITDYFDNTHAFGFTKNMTETRFKGVGATYDPQNERNKNLSKVKTTTAMVSNLLNVGGFIKDFMGNMRNSPSKSNYKGVDEDAMTYTPVKGAGYLHPTPDYLNPTKAFESEVLKQAGFLPQFKFGVNASNYKDDSKPITDSDPAGIESKWFSGPPKSPDKWNGFKKNWKDGDKESALEFIWGGSSLYQDSEQENRVDALNTNLPDGNLQGKWDTDKSGLYSFNPQVRTDQWWGQGKDLSWIPLTGDDSQDKWDEIGERFLSGPRAMQRAGERIAEFSKSPNFLIFEGKQLALNALNSTNETRIYNPLSLSSAFSSGLRIQRHLGGTYETILGSSFAPEGRVKEQSGYRGGTTYKQPDIKKVDPNRFATGFMGVNKLAQLGAQALGRMASGTDKLKYTQDVTLSKDGIKYENTLTPKKPYLDSVAHKDRLSEKTLDPNKEGGMPKHLLVQVNRNLTFRKDGKIKQTAKSAIETIYEKYQSSPSEISKGHSGYGGTTPGSVMSEGKDKDTSKSYATLDPIKKDFKPTNDGEPSMPEGGYEKEGLIKGGHKQDQPQKYKTNMRIDGGRGFSSAVSTGGDRSDWTKSGEKDSRGNETKDEINVIPYGEPGKTPWENKDFVPLKFLDMYNEKQIVFRASFKSLTESVTPDWQSLDYIGRPDQMHVYKGLSRDLNMNFIIYPYTYKEFKVLWAKLNYLVGLAMPSYEKLDGGGERMVAPFIKLTVGDLYKKCPGYLKSFNVDYDMAATWEINNGERLPKKISVTCDFVYIGNEQPKIDGNNYGFDAEKFNQNKL